MAFACDRSTPAATKNAEYIAALIDLSHFFPYTTHVADLAGPSLLRACLPHPAAMLAAPKTIEAKGASVSWTGQKASVVRIFNLFVEQDDVLYGV